MGMRSSRPRDVSIPVLAQSCPGVLSQLWPLRVYLLFVLCQLLPLRVSLLLIITTPA